MASTKRIWDSDRMLGIKEEDENKVNWRVIYSVLQNPSEEITIKALEQSPSLIKHIFEPNEAFQLAAVESNPYSIKHIRNPTPKVQMLAVKKNYACLNQIRKKVRIPELDLLDL